MNEIAFIGFHMVVLYDHKTPENSSTYFPLAYSNIFFNIPSKVFGLAFN